MEVDMDYQSLSSLCTQVRGDILNMTHKAGSGHPGGSLSAVELLVGLDVYKRQPVSFFFCGPA